ncbi:MAG: hypothetical protein K9M08_01105 [Pirellula sp.]|nr:hypothetical protein [Pirellula sp.]MCY2977174.1 hypothetical protein [Planctomycetota bacterium]
MTKFVACLGIAAIAMVANVVVPKSTLLVTETFHSSIFGGAFVYVDCNMSDYTEPLCRAKAGMSCVVDHYRLFNDGQDLLDMLSEQRDACTANGCINEEMVWTYPETVSPCTKTHKTTQ